MNNKELEKKLETRIDNQHETDSRIFDLVGELEEQIADNEKMLIYYTSRRGGKNALWLERIRKWIEDNHMKIKEIKIKFI